MRRMVARWSAGPAAAAAALILVAGCGGGDNKTATGSGTPSPTAATTQPSPTEQPATALTKAQLTAALITAKDLPAGYKLDPSASEDDSGSTTGDAGCLKMDATDVGLRKGTQPSEVAYAKVSFTTADNMGGGDETLASFKTEDSAGTQFSQYAAAADSCHSLGLKVDPSNTIKLTGKPLSAAATGDESRAYRYVGTFQGLPFWLDAMVFRSGSTLALVSVGGVGSAPREGLLEQIATKSAAKLT